MRYKLLGTEEGSAICEFCHRKELTMLYHVQNLETGEYHVFGSSCVKKALKICDSEFKAMKATMELAELRKPFDLKLVKTSEASRYYRTPAIYTASIFVDGVEFIRSRACLSKKDFKTVFTETGYWTNAQTRCICAKVSDIVVDDLRTYFRTKTRLEKIIKEYEQG